MGETLLCDFCGVEDPPWEFPARGIGLPAIRWESFGPWCACDNCKELIEGRDREGLLARSITHAPKGLTPEAIRVVHEVFFEAWTGEDARPVEVTPVHGRLFDR